MIKLLKKWFFGGENEARGSYTPSRNILPPPPPIKKENKITIPITLNLNIEICKKQPID